MNLRFVFKLVGRVELMVAASLLLPLAVALFYGESPWPFVLTMGLILCVCAPLARMSARPVFFQREGFVIGPILRSCPGAFSSGGASPTGWGAWECWCWPRRCFPPWGPAPST